MKWSCPAERDAAVTPGHFVDAHVTRSADTAPGAGPAFGKQAAPRRPKAKSAVTSNHPFFRRAGLVWEACIWVDRKVPRPRRIEVGRWALAPRRALERHPRRRNSGPAARPDPLRAPGAARRRRDGRGRALQGSLDRP